MVFTFEETKAIEELKQKNKTDFENLRHTNQMTELNKQLEIAKEKAVKE